MSVKRRSFILVTLVFTTAVLVCYYHTVTVTEVKLKRTSVQNVVGTVQSETVAEVTLKRTSVQNVVGTVQSETKQTRGVQVVSRNISGTINRPYHLSGSLSPDLIKGIKKFVYFVGYHRSGHSIVGTLLDAHPHVVIAHEYFVSSHFPDLNKAPNETWKDNLFNTLYRKSVHGIHLRQYSHPKGYSLAVKGLWMGEFDSHIEAIGDKSGGRVTLDYLKDKKTFIRNYKMMKENISIPIRILHVVRNPFDMISTHTIINVIGDKGLGKLKKQSLTSPFEKLNASKEVHDVMINVMFRKFDAVQELIEYVFGKENVQEIHNNDLVTDPRGTLLKIFQFLEVDTTEHYLDVCAEKVFKSVYRSRDLMVWPPEQREWVEERMKNYKILSRYNFTSD